jgi:hypothetical protein
MNLRFFIDRPVFSGVISVVIVLMGVIHIQTLQIHTGTVNLIDKYNCRDLQLL